MNWETVSTIAQIASAIAIVISLIYLALQVRFARLLASDTSRTARSGGVRANVLAMANNTELCKYWLKSSGLKSEYEQLGE